MQGVDPEAALKMYSEKGEWQKCLQLAEKQVKNDPFHVYTRNQSTCHYCVLFLSQGAVVLEKYVALYAAHLIKSNAALTALQLFTKYGTPPNPQVQ